MIVAAWERGWQLADFTMDDQVGANAPSGPRERGPEEGSVNVTLPGLGSGVPSRGHANFSSPKTTH